MTLLALGHALIATAKFIAWWMAAGVVTLLGWAAIGRGFGKSSE